LPSHWEGTLKKLPIRVCIPKLAIFVITLIQILFCCFPYTREHESLHHAVLFTLWGGTHWYGWENLWCECHTRCE